MGHPALPKRSVLVLGANAGQADLIKYFQAKGWRVVSCSNRDGEPGEKISDKFISTDATDVEAISKIVIDERISLVYSVASDIVNSAVTEVSKRFGFPYFFDSELISLLNNKVSLRRHLRLHELCNVAFKPINSVDQCAGWAHYPCIVKPADSQGQRGVVKVNDAVMLLAAAKTALSISRTHTAIIEEFCHGPEISCNVLVCNDQLIISEFSERLVHSDEHFGLPKGHILPPINIGEADLHAADSLIRQTINSLSVRKGPLYFQMIVTSKGPKILEIAPRIDGCHIWHLIKFARGIDYIDLTIRCLLGQNIKPCFTRHANIQPHILSFLQLSPGSFQEIQNIPIPVDALYHEYRYNPGDQIIKVNGKYEVVGYYIRQLSQMPEEDSI